MSEDVTRTSAWPLGLSLLLALYSVGTADAAPSTSGSNEVAERVRLSPITFAQDYANGAPVGPATTFKAGRDTIYAVVKFTGLRLSDTMTFYWFQNDSLEFEKQYVLAQTFQNLNEKNAGTLASWWTPKDRFAPGHYRVEIRVDGGRIEQGAFDVK